MADTGHAKNVANFETVIIILVGLGAVYDPSQALIMLAALQALLTGAKAAIAAVKSAEAAETIAAQTCTNRTRICADLSDTCIERTRACTDLTDTCEKLF